MATLPESVDYTDKDFDALRARLIALIKSVFPDWTDFDVASFGNLLVELYAYVGDVLTFYVCRWRASPSRPARCCARRRSPSRCASSSSRPRSSRPPPIRRACSCWSRTRRRTRSSSTRAGSPTSSCISTSPRTSTTRPSSRRRRVRSPRSTASSTRARTTGTSWSPSTTVSVTNKTGGGSAGNVDAERIAVIEGAFKDAYGNAVQVSVRNPAPASGGADRQTVASAKLLAPESLRALTRTVAREDFEINARRLSGVARSLMLTSNEDPTIAENTGILYVIPQSQAPGAIPTPALKNLVLQQVTEVYPCTLTFQVSVQDPVYKTVDVAARIFLRQGYAPNDVRDRVRANLAAYFRVNEPDGTPNPLVDFGFNIKDAEGNPVGEIAWSDLFNVIRDTPGVRKMGDARLDLTLNGLPADVRLNVREFPVLRTVTLVNGDTGELL